MSGKGELHSGMWRGRAVRDAAVNRPRVGVELEDDLVFGTVCAPPRQLRIEVCNWGGAALTVYRVAHVAGSAAFEIAEQPILPVCIRPGGCVPFVLRFTPRMPGRRESATLRISTNDPERPHFEVNTSGRMGVGPVEGMTVDVGRLGEVCVGNHAYTSISITNRGPHALSVFNVTASSSEFQLPAAASYPRVVEIGARLVVPLRFEPATAGLKVAVLMVMSDDLQRPVKIRTGVAYARWPRGYGICLKRSSTCD